MHPFRVPNNYSTLSGGLRCAATTGYYLAALQAGTRSLRLPVQTLCSVPLEWHFCHSINMNETTRNPETYFNEAAGEASVRRLQIVRAGSHHFGIPIENISTITAWREPAPLPFAPPSVLGVVSIEGRMLTVMDLARLTAAEAEASEVASGHIVALRGDEQLALAVEEVGETIEFNLAESNAQQQMSSSVVAGVFHHDETAIHILNLKELFPAAIQGRERRRRRF